MRATNSICSPVSNLSSSHLPASRSFAHSWNTWSCSRNMVATEAKSNDKTLRCSTSAILGFNEYVQSLIDKDGGASIPPGSKDSMSPDHAGEHSGGYPISSTVPTALDLFLSSHI
ncbi:hypothetical protein AcV5_003129 [Taiwanofungus camphoratus]|nr:hypothetical protein AcV5_003129 [Antrodia cinnamomea]KAI0929556.1 hypothetical protein AcV7_005385 [Antrodia cinnamomea]